MTAVALTVVLSLAGGPTPTVGQAVQQYRYAHRIVVQATLAERHPPTWNARGTHQSTQLLFQDVRRQDEPSADCPEPTATEMTCKSMFNEDLTLFEPGDPVVMYSNAYFEGSQVQFSRLWFLADNDCHDEWHGDIPMYCRPEDEVVATDDGGRRRGTAMSGKRTRGSILCGNRAPVAVVAKKQKRPGTQEAEKRPAAEKTEQRRSTHAPLRSPHSVARARPDRTRSSRVIELRNAAQGDFNRDGDIDLAIASSQGTTVQLVLGQGERRFLPAGVIAVDERPTAIAAGHVNRDEHVDLVVAHSVWGAVVVFLGDGEGNFERTTALNSMRSVCALTIGDFDGGPAPDVAVAHCGLVNGSRDALTILAGDGSGDLDPVVLSAQRLPDSVALADVNEDGAMDIVTLDPAGGVLEVFLSE
jgi:hypothetical protein